MTDPQAELASVIELIERPVSDGFVHPYPWLFTVTHKGVRHQFFGIPNQCATAEASEREAARYRWLRDRLIAADFDYGHDEDKCCAVVFQWPENAKISADLDASIDAAMKMRSQGVGG